MKIIRRMVIATLVGAGLLVIVFLWLSRRPELSERHGQLDTHLYIHDTLPQPLIVAFGGGSGGNDWERNYLKSKRDSLLALGYGVLAIGYFKTENSPESLDRISLNAIADTIMSIARRTPAIDTSCIILMGASKGGELVLNLASRYSCFKGVIALSTSQVSFPAITVAANTSSWTYHQEEVPYVPAPFETLWPALQGDLHTAFSMMLADSLAVREATIAVEKINGPVLIVSADADEQWPAREMSQHLIQRLERMGFAHPYQHVIVRGAHIAPLDHFEVVYDFLRKLRNERDTRQ